MALFTKRHYLAVSDYLQTINSFQYRNDVAEAMNEIFERDNPAFDSNLFYENCGLNVWRLEEQHT